MMMKRENKKKRYDLGPIARNSNESDGRLTDESKPFFTTHHGSSFDMCLPK
jgi:hypothetical protein